MSASAPSGSSDSKRRWPSFVLCLAVATLTALDVSKVNVGIPAIEDALGAGPSQLQLITAGYALAFGLALVPAGRYGDVSSRRTMFLFGIGLFAVTSLVCALAPGATTLVVARIGQGVAAGVLMPQVFGLIQQLFTGPERGRAFGMFGAVLGISTAIGPTLGGVLIALGGTETGWRLLFWMNVPIAAVIFPAAARLLPRTQPRPPGPAPSLDLVGIALLGAAVLALMLPFVLTTGRPGDVDGRWWLIPASIALTALFIGWERGYARRARTPVVDFALFRIVGYRNGVLVGMSYFGAVPATFLILTLYVQQGAGLSALIAGMVMIPFAVASALSSWVAGRLVNRAGGALVLFGILLVIAGFAATVLATVLVGTEAVVAGMAAGMFVAGLGGGAVMSANQTLMLSEVPVSQGGVASSVAQLAQRLGTAVGLAGTSAAFFATVLAAGGSQDELYDVAYRNAAAVTMLFLAGALAVALIDWRWRRNASLAR